MGGQADALGIPALASGTNDLKRPTGLMSDIYDELLGRLAVEPCMAECDRDTQDRTEAANKLRKGIAPR